MDNVTDNGAVPDLVLPDLVDDAITALDRLDPLLADAVRRLRRSYEIAVDHVAVQAQGQLRYRDEMNARLAAQQERFDRACASMAGRMEADRRALTAAVSGR